MSRPDFSGPVCNGFSLVLNGFSLFFLCFFLQARWVKIVVEKIAPQLVTNGGPVIMLQVENEYGPDDDYLRWAVDMARNLTTDVPCTMTSTSFWAISHASPGHAPPCTRRVLCYTRCLGLPGADWGWRSGIVSDLGLQGTSATTCPSAATSTAGRTK